MELDVILKAINAGGAVGTLVVILWGGARGWWVYGSHYRDMRQERDEWKHVALTGTDLAGEAVTVAKAAAGRRTR